MPVQLVGITPDIDSCARLIQQKSAQSYARIRDVDKRWLDLDDIVQDNLVRAVSAGRSHVKGAGQKFSTHLFNRLMWGTGNAAKALDRPKRAISGALVEIDAPVPHGDSGETQYELPDGRALEGVEAGAVTEGRISAFQSLVGAIQVGVSARQLRYSAITHLVRVLLFKQRQSIPLAPEVLAVLAVAAKRARISFTDFAGWSDDEITRKKLLHWAAVAVIMESGAENKLRSLECVKCESLFTLADVRMGAYYLDPAMCRACYNAMAADRGTCFGKQHTETQLGFQRTDSACRLHCPDREVCREFIKQRRNGMTTAAEKTTKLDKKLAKGLDELDDKKPAKKPVSEKTASKKAKPAEDDVEDPAPKEVGGEWPWRSGSCMRYAFQAAFAGISAKAFKALFEKGGELYKIGNHDYMLKKLRSGFAGKAVKTHTWNFSEEGGKFKIYNVKYLVKKKAEAAEQPKKKSAGVKAAKADKKKKLAKDGKKSGAAKVVKTEAE